MMKRTLLTLLVSACLVSGGLAAGAQNLIVQAKDEKTIKRIQKKYGAQLLGQINGQDGQGIFQIQIDDSRKGKKGKSSKQIKGQDISKIQIDDGKKGKKGKSSKSTKELDKLIKEILNEKGIVSVEPNYPLSVDAGVGPDLEWSVMSLFWSVMSLFGEKTPTDFYGTEVIEGYANQPALDVIHASDIRSVSTGAGTRVAFIDTGVDPDHPALRPWIDEGIDLLGTGLASELSGLDWSVMSLFEDTVRIFKRGLGLDWSVMSLFLEHLEKLGLDWSVMSLFSDQLQKLGVDLDWSVMSLFWSVMSLFSDDVETLDLDWSVMSLFSEEVEQLNLDWSVMSLFGDADGNAGGGMPAKFGHGTLVAGLIHAVAPEAQLVPVRAFDPYSNSTLFLATAAVYAAVDLDVDVINMSFSIGTDSAAFQSALNYAWSQGVTLVASVGNDGIDAGDIYPAAYPKVIGVAATNLEDQITSFSNFGKTVDVTAPGEIVSTYPGGLYARASGTSFSAPMVSGSVALLASLGKRNKAAAQTVVNTADSVYESNPDLFRQALGQGRVNLLNALGVN